MQGFLDEDVFGCGGIAAILQPLAQPKDIDALVALLEEHGIVPEQGSSERGEVGSWGLTHRYIFQRVKESDSLPMTVDEVRAILKGKNGHPSPGKPGHALPRAEVG